MRPYLISTVFLGVLSSFVTGDACVVGGPADEVTDAKYCCARAQGTWYQFYDVQAICVMDSSVISWYTLCVDHIPGYPGLDATCIPGDGGLPTAAPSSLTAPPRTTLT